MKNTIIKKGLGAISVLVLMLTLIINSNVLNPSTSNLSIASLVSLNTANAEWPFDPQPWEIWGKKEKLKRCQLDLGGGWFTSSVKTGCISIICVIPLDCSCEETACGESN